MSYGAFLNIHTDKHEMDISDYFRLGYSISPVLIGATSTIFLFFKLRKAKTKYATPSIAGFDSLIISLRKYKWAIISLTSLESLVWVYQTIIFMLDHDNHQLFDLIHAFSFCALWILFFILSVLSPNRNYYHSQSFTPVFVFVYCYTVLDSIYKAFSPEYSKIFNCLNIFLSSSLFLIAGFTPRPIHPRDVYATEAEHVEIKDGIVYRENSRLSPESNACIFSRIIFEWMSPIIILSRKSTISPENLYALTFQQRAQAAHQDFVDTLKKIAKNRVIRRAYESNKAELWIQSFFSVLNVFVSYLGPYFQQRLLEYIEKPDGRPVNIAYAFVFGAFIVGVLKLNLAGTSLYVGRRSDMRLRGMLCAEIFSKTMRRKDMSGRVSDDKEEEKEEEQKSKDTGKKKDENPYSNTGKITNLMSVDTDFLGDLPNFLPFLYTPLLEVTVALFYLYQLLGVATLVGFAVMLVLFPVTAYISHKLTQSYLDLSKAKDYRNELLNELLQGIRMIKYFAWEKKWMEKVSEARKKEIDRLITKIKLDLLMTISYLAVPVIVTVSSFVWYTKVAGNELTASVAFVSITLFEMLRRPLLMLPDSVSLLSEVYVSFKRISGYLDEPEIDVSYKSEVITVPEGSSPESVLARVGFEESVFVWHREKKEEEPPRASSPTSPLSEVPPPSVESTLNNTNMPASKFQLTIPKFDFPTGKLSLVCGPTGSGKTSFLHALLGEMDTLSGRAYIPSKTILDTPNYSKVDSENSSLYLDRVAYVAQQAFLQHASIRDNILFGLPFDPVRYKIVLKQCALMKDLSILPDGDRTEIGEKGISLSGGQKQRVSLARAVYSYAKTVILDDCLSAVDAHTAKYIYRNCITGDLLKGRTVILVTHHVRLCLPGAYFLVKIERGKVVCNDTVENLKRTGTIQKYVGKDAFAEKEIEDIVGVEEEEEDDDLNYELDLDLENKKDAAKLIQEEKREKGEIKIQVYLTYLKACGGWIFWIVLLFSYVLTRLINFYQSWWLRVWAAAYSTSSDIQDPSSFIMASNVPSADGWMSTVSSVIAKQNVFRPWVFQEKEPVNVDYYIGVCILISSVSVICEAFKYIWLYWGTIRGSRVLFSAMVDRIIHAPMRFFDTTPLGRILNRFGKDITAIDNQLAHNFGMLIECTTGVAASVLVITSITPQFIFVAVLISFVYLIVGNLYLHVSRDLKRLSSVGASPIYSHFTESLTGVTTIRAYGVEAQFMDTLYKKVNAFITPYYFLWMSNRWLYARIEFIGAFVNLFAGVFLLLNLNSIDAGMAGISLFYARSFLENIYWFIRQYTTVEMNLNAVERVQEYLEIDQEPPAYIEGHRPPASWPTTAAVEVKDLVVRYAPDLDPVLHGISFTTKPHEKLGIVGRTGSGKSTLSLSIFRFLEASSGSISIDGIDISKIGMEDLRSRMTIIPQDAILFSGTIRSNLDPFEEHSDQAVWESLERAHLVKHARSQKDNNSSSESSSSRATSQGGEEVEEGEGEHFVSTISSLDQKVSDGGNNYSQGQRQLLCLARALLKNSKLIIMDEATASVDHDTDSKIQDTIRQEFTNSTLLTIAHRLRTIIDYDRVLVLDQGKVIELDTPYNLIQANGVFRSMCEKSGEFDVLLRMATASHQQRENEEEITPDNHATVY